MIGIALQKENNYLGFPEIAPVNLMKAKNLYAQGKILFREKKFPESFEKLLEAKAITSENYFCRVLIAKVMEQVFPIHMVDDFHKKSLELDCNNHKYLAEYAAFLVKQNNTEYAIDLYEKAIQLAPEIERYPNELSRLLTKLNKVSVTQNNIENITKKTENIIAPATLAKAKTLYAEGKILFQKKQYTQAFEKVTEAKDLTSENYFCRVLIARIMEPIYDSNIVTAFHEKSIELDPNSHKYFSLYAAFLVRQNKLEQAVDFYKKAIALAPETERYYIELSRLLSTLEKTEEAIICYQKLVEIDAGNSKTLTTLGSLFTRSRRYEEAEDAFKKASSCEVKDENCLIAWFGALMQQRKYAEALPILLDAIKTNSDKHHLYLRLADIYSGLKMHAEAVKVLEKYLPYATSDSEREAILRRKIIHAQRAGEFTLPEQRVRFFAMNSFHSNKPDLSPVQKRVVEEALDTGMSMTSIDELFDESDKDMVQATIEQVMEFRHSESTLKLIEDIKNCEDFSKDPQFAGVFKPSVVNFLNNNRSMNVDFPMVQMFLSRKIMDIANCYNNMLSKIRNVNLWVNPTIKGKNIGVRRGSQVWHRDQEDEKVLKCFIYLTDVGPNSGALDYVPFSKCIPDRKFSDLHPYPFGSGYPGEMIFNQHIKEEFVTASCKKGGIVFVDTNGFHRGGYVTENERIVLMATYLRPTSPYTNTNLVKHLDCSNIPVRNYSTDILYAIS